MLAAIARLVTAHPRRVLTATVALLTAAVAFGAPVTGKLTVEPDLDFIDPAAQSNVTGIELRRAIGRGLGPGIVVVVRSDQRVRSAAGRAQLRKVVRRIERDPSIATTDSALRDPRPSSPFISRDGRSSFVAAYLRSGADGEETGLRIERAVGDLPGVLVGGGAIAGPVVGDQVSEDLAKAEMIAFPLLFLLTLIVFRGAVAALLPLFVGLLTIMTTFLGLRLFNEATALAIFALNLAIGLGLGLASDYSLFIL